MVPFPRFLPLLLATSILGSTASAAESIPGPLEAALVSCYDGDTCDFNIRIWLGLTVHTGVRMRGFDTPEMAGKCQAERDQAREARARMLDILSTAKKIQLLAVEPDKYGGRVLASVFVDGVPVAGPMITAGLARPYEGESREGWCK